MFDQFCIYTKLIATWKNGNEEAERLPLSKFKKKLKFDTGDLVKFRINNVRIKKLQSIDHYLDGAFRLLRQ